MKPWQMTQQQYIEAVGSKMLEDYEPQGLENLKSYIRVEDFAEPFAYMEINDQKVDFRRFLEASIDEEKGNNLGIAAFVDSLPLGYVDSAGRGRLEFIVAQEVQNLGIGTNLMVLFRELYPFHPTGGFTEAGLAVTKKAHKVMVEAALEDGEEVPEEVLKEHELVKESKVEEKPKTAAWFGKSLVPYLRPQQPQIEEPQVGQPQLADLRVDSSQEKKNDLLPILLSRFRLRRDPHDLNRLQQILEQLNATHLYDWALKALKDNGRRFGKIQSPRRGRGKRKRGRR
jgi:hypothetical protein